VGVSLRRKLWIIALVYVIEGFPMGVYGNVWPVFFRRNDVSLAEIGLLAGLSIAWSAKVLWSPLVDRFGERRRWIAGALLVMAACLMLFLGAPAERIGALLWIAMTLYCVASATQDIAIDAYTIGLVDRGEEGPANSVRVTAYRAGMIAAGGGLLFLPRWVGWNGTFAAAALASAAMAAVVFVCPRVEVPPESRRDTFRSLRRWLDRPGVIPVAGFILLYRVGDRALGPMIHPFWVDRGFSNEEIATVSTTLGALALVAGAIAGGIVVARVGIHRSLWVLGLLALASNLAYAGAAAVPEAGAAGVYAASVVESFCGGLATAAFMSFLMRVCEKEHAAVQYALLTALYALAGSAVAMPSGALTERLGYASYFAATAVFALPAFAFLPGVRSWIEPDGVSVAPAGSGER
jgi:PAT family beta-lactamase induction signal transducer AmpG